MMKRLSDRMMSINAQRNEYVDTCHDRQALHELEQFTHNVADHPQSVDVLPDHLVSTSKIYYNYRAITGH